MKNTLTAAFGLLLIILGSCKNEPIEPNNRYFVTASLNGETWSTTLVIGSLKNGSVNEARISMFVFNDEGVLRESFSIYNLPLTEGLHFINPYISGEIPDSLFTFYHTSVDDGDVTGTFYHSSGDSSDYVRVLNYDPLTGDIEASFHVRLVTDVQTISPGDPEEVLFEDGYFKTKLKM